MTTPNIKALAEKYSRLVTVIHDNRNGFNVDADEIRGIASALLRVLDKIKDAYIEGHKKGFVNGYSDGSGLAEEDWEYSDAKKLMEELGGE